MLEVARYLEQITARFNPVVLVGPGLAAALLGLFIWLGGMGFRKVLFAFLGAVSGGVCGFFIMVHSVWLAIVLAVVFAIIAVILERFFATILSAVLVAAICFVVLAQQYVEKGEKATSVSPDQKQNKAEFSVQQSVKVAKECMSDFVTVTKQTFLSMPKRNWAVMGVLAAVFILTGFFQRRLTLAYFYGNGSTVII